MENFTFNSKISFRYVFCLTTTQFDIVAMAEIIKQDIDPKSRLNVGL